MFYMKRRSILYMYQTYIFIRNYQTNYAQCKTKYRVKFFVVVFLEGGGAHCYKYSGEKVLSNLKKNMGY